MTPHILLIAQGSAHLAGFTSLPLSLMTDGTFRIFHVDEAAMEKSEAARLRLAWEKMIAQKEGKTRGLVARDQRALEVHERQLPEFMRIVPVHLWKAWNK